MPHRMSPLSHSLAAPLLPSLYTSPPLPRPGAGRQGHQEGQVGGGQAQEGGGGGWVPACWATSRGAVTCCPRCPYPAGCASLDGRQLMPTLYYPPPPPPPPAAAPKKQRKPKKEKVGGRVGGAGRRRRPWLRSCEGAGQHVAAAAARVPPLSLCRALACLPTLPPPPPPPSALGRTPTLPSAPPQPSSTSPKTTAGWVGGWGRSVGERCLALRWAVRQWLDTASPFPRHLGASAWPRTRKA